MKRKISLCSLVLSIFLLVGCGSVISVTPIQSYSLNEVKTSPIGSAFLVAETGTITRRKSWVGILKSQDGSGWEIQDQYSPDWRSKELTYAGVSGKTIEVAYREFRGGYAAPAFSQNLKYDLAASKTIRFQNFEIQVLKADNNSITYKILKDR
jgi:hypothetical protein